MDAPNITAANLYEHVLRPSMERPVMLVFWSRWAGVDALEGFEPRNAVLALANVEVHESEIEGLAEMPPWLQVFHGGHPVDLAGTVTRATLQRADAKCGEMAAYVQAPQRRALHDAIESVLHHWVRALRVEPDDAVAQQALDNIAVTLAQPDVLEWAQLASAKMGITTGRHEALEQALAADPDNDEIWSLYADWLQSEGDVRGEIIAFELADDPRADVLTRACGDLLLGGFADAFNSADSLPGGRGSVALEWARGFIREAALWIAGPGQHRARGIITDLFANAPLLDGLVLQVESLAPGVQRLLGTATPRGLRRFRLGAIGGDAPSIDLGPLFSRCPHLSVLQVGEARASGFPAQSPTLRRVELPGDALSTREIIGMTAERYPKLEALGLVGPTERDGLVMVATCVEMPSVHALSLTRTVATHRILQAVLDSPLPERLTELDLSEGTLDDDDATALLEAAPRFSRLRRLELDSNHIEGLHDELTGAFGDAISLGFQAGDWYGTLEE